MPRLAKKMARNLKLDTASQLSIWNWPQNKTFFNKHIQVHAHTLNMSCRRNVRVGDKVFKYKKDLIAYVRKQIQNADLDQDFFVELMQHHRSRKSDLYDSSGIPRRFHVGTACFFKGPTLCIEGNEEPISWRHAVDMVFAKDLKVLKKKDDVKYALQCMRYEVRFSEGATLQEFLRGWDGEHCSLCENKNKPQADHHPLRFEDIVEGFLEERKLSYEDIGRMPKEHARFDKSGTIHLFVSRSFGKDWLTYHDARAKYRWLCRTCNIRGNTGVKKRKHM